MALAPAAAAAPVVALPRAVLRLLSWGAAAAGAGLAVLVGEAIVATTRGYLDADSAPDVDRTFGSSNNPLLRLVVLGDSTAAGIGVERAEDTVAGHLAAMLALEGHRVAVTSVAVAGSRTHDLGPQVSRALLAAQRPDLAIVLVGTNDATRLTPMAPVRRSLADAVTRLSQAGVVVVVGTCPDLGAIRAVPQPLRLLIALRGREIAAAQSAVTQQAGGHPVDLAARTGRAFRRDPATLASDRFHPSGRGYRLWAQALLPAVHEEIGLRLPH